MVSSSRPTAPPRVMAAAAANPTKEATAAAIPAKSRELPRARNADNGNRSTRCPSAR